MSFLSLVLALLLEQMAFVGLRTRVEAAWRAWTRWCLGRGVNRPDGGVRPAWVSALAILAPACAAVGIQSVLGGFLGSLWMLLVLFSCLGFSQYIRSAAVLRQAVEWRDTAAIAQIVSVQTPELAFMRAGVAAQALAASLVLAQAQLLAVVMAVFVGWLIGAPLLLVVAWVAALHWREAIGQASMATPGGDPGVAGLQRAAAWATAICLALCGRFDAVVAALRTPSVGQARTPVVLLGDAAGAALGLPEDWMDVARSDDDPDAVTLEHLLRWERLVWRALGVLLLVFAVFTVLAA